jgi:acetyl-CoA C-acetyltransferase
MPHEVYVLSAVRTAIGRFGGSLRNIPAQNLGAIVIREAIARAGRKSGEGFYEYR